MGKREEIKLNFDPCTFSNGSNLSGALQNMSTRGHCRPTLWQTRVGLNLLWEDWAGDQWWWGNETINNSMTGIIKNFLTLSGRPSAPQMPSLWILATTPWGRYYPYSHYVNEESEIQRGWIILPGSQSWESLVFEIPLPWAPRVVLPPVMSQSGESRWACPCPSVGWADRRMCVCVPTHEYKANTTLPTVSSESSSKQQPSPQL